MFQKWSTIAAKRKKSVDFGFLQLIVDGSRSRKAAAFYCELVVGGSVAVAVSVSDI